MRGICIFLLHRALSSTFTAFSTISLDLFVYFYCIVHSPVLLQLSPPYPWICCSQFNRPCSKDAACQCHVICNECCLVMQLFHVIASRGTIRCVLIGNPVFFLNYSREIINSIPELQFRLKKQILCKFLRRVQIYILNLRMN
jgi:hypothetical protein